MGKSIISSILQNAKKWPRLISNSSIFREVKTASNLQCSNNPNCKQKKLYDQTATNLLKEPKECVQKWLDSFDAVLSDCDGVLWVNKDPLEGSVDAFNRFKEMGKKAYFCTNNSHNTRTELLEKGTNMGFNICLNEIMSAAHATAEYFKKICFTEKIYLIGKRGLAKELDDACILHTDIGPDLMPSNTGDCMSAYFKPEDGIGAVLVAFDDHISFPKLIRAAKYLEKSKCLFIATNADELSPMKDVPIPGTGCLVCAIETCVNRKALIIGKPNPEICKRLIDSKEIVPERTLMLGDRCNTDILLGYNCGFQTLLVGSGIHDMKYVECLKRSKDPQMRKQIPDTYLPKFGDVLEFIDKC